MSEPYVEHRDAEQASPGRGISFIFPMFLFLLGLALLSLGFNYSWGAWLFVGGILSISLAFAIPTTILPALEDR